MEISRLNQERHYKLPIYGNSADIVIGANVMRGATPDANGSGCLVVAGGTSAIPDSVGVMGELHDYSVSGDTLLNGTSFVTRNVNLYAPGRIITVDYSLASADLITCTQAVNTTTMTVTSLEDNIDGAFIYVVSGTGAGQTNYLTASASGACTLKAAFGTSLDTTSKFIKIYPRFFQTVGFNTAGTKLTSTAAAASVTACTIDMQIVRAGRPAQLDPTKHDALTGLNNTRGLAFRVQMILRNTAFFSID